MALFILLAGLLVYSRMQTALFPEISFPKIKVIADAGLQPVDKMMVTVTKPLENAIRRVPDLNYVRSITSRGTCEISAFMDWSANIDLSQQRIESRINEMKSDLPPDVQITVERMNPSILPVMGYTLESRNKNPIELKQIANYIVRPYLSQVSGVSEVRVIGGKTKEYWLTLDAHRLSELSLTPEEVDHALSQTNFIRSNGYISDYRYLYLTVTDATVHTIDDIQKLVIRNDGNRIVLLGDIAKVSVQQAVEFTKINANGKDGVLIAVIKQPNANLVQLSGLVEEKIKGLANLLPEGVTIQPYYIQADFVRDAIRSVSDSVWAGLLLAIVVAIIFLRSLRASATILISIPVTLGLTLMVLFAFGYTINIMTLGAMAAAIGLVIDDAIVIVEQIHRTREEHPDYPAARVVWEAVSWLMPAMIGSSVSTVVIFIPFLWMTGVAGAYFKVMTNTMIITLVCSFAVTWIILPVIYLLFAPSARSAGHSQTKLPRAPRKGRWVYFFIRRPLLSLILVASLVLSSWYIVPRLETGFLPEMDEGSIVLDYVSPPGTSLEETDRMLREVEKILATIPEVQAYSRRTGTQMGFFITEPNQGDYLIQLKNQRSRTTDGVISDIRKKIEASQPALRVDLGQVIGDMLGDLTTSVQPIEIKIFGDDQERLKGLARNVKEIIDSVPGVADPFDGIVVAGPSVRVEPDFARLAQFGLTPASLQYQVQTALQGQVVGSILEREQMTEVRMVYPGSRQASVSELERMQIFLPNGKLRPIADLARVVVSPGDAEIQRENNQSMAVVSARLENRDLGSVVKEIQQKVGAQVALPRGYHIIYGGAYADQQQSFRELLFILISSSLLVFGVILFLFRDFRAAFLILLLAVLGISGSWLALFLTQTPLNVGSYTGLIMIVGIIGENSIFSFRQFETALTTRGVDEAIAYTISTRLRPKLMTALGAIIALAPLASGFGSGAQMHQPLAIAVIGGFVVALPLLLIVLPTCLRLIYRRRKSATGASA